MYVRFSSTDFHTTDVILFCNYYLWNPMKPLNQLMLHSSNNKVDVINCTLLFYFSIKLDILDES